MSPLPIPQTKAAIDFLAAAHSTGPYHLVAIEEGVGIDARTFSGDDPQSLSAWIEERQGRKNLYWHVNVLRPNVRDMKATKQDVAEAGFLHVDVDDPDALERIKAYAPRPTAIVFSGGGYQAFWRLTEPSVDFGRIERCNQ